MKKCLTKYCRTKTQKRHCTKCQKRIWRKANPDKARFGNLKTRAWKKGLSFDLDLEWLNNFLTASGYDPTLHHIDRVSVLGGYTKNNLQILPFSENIAKGNRERHGQAHMF